MPKIYTVIKMALIGNIWVCARIFSKTFRFWADFLGRFADALMIKLNQWSDQMSKEEIKSE
jgi:hypothetical protein